MRTATRKTIDELVAEQRAAVRETIDLIGRRNGLTGEEPWRQWEKYVAQCQLWGQSAIYAEFESILMERARALRTDDERKAAKARAFQS